MLPGLAICTVREFYKQAGEKEEGAAAKIYTLVEIKIFSFTKQ